ncbi:hypothetical protein GY45DRAFT_1432498 [Cubamyces sp. BRFM 1775]|nr:hypothetical protein GY45DRAFT_1432498 [Cubamyces sp. BRFM 1775]
MPEALHPEAPYNPKDIVRILECLVDLCPGVTELEMYPQYPGRIVSASLDFAYDCHRLEVFHVNPVLYGPQDPGLISYLATRPHLRKVCLSMDEETAQDLSFLSAPPVLHPFSSLQILFLTAPEISACRSFLQLLGDCRLFSIKFEVFRRPLGEDVYWLFDTMRRHCARHTLHAFHLNQYGLCESDEPQPHPTPEYTISLPAIQPALYFSNMRVFLLDLPLYGWLSDEHLREIADAWPGLANFAFFET